MNIICGTDCLVIVCLYRMKCTKIAELLKGILYRHFVNICLELCLQKQRLHSKWLLYSFFSIYLFRNLEKKDDYSY